MPAPLPTPLLAAFFSRLPLLPLLLWGSLIASTVALLFLMRTRWGQQRPTHRYVMLSIVAHLLLICVATTIRFASSPAGDGPAPVQVRIVMRTPPSEEEAPKEPKPVEPTTDPVVETPPTPAPEVTERIEPTPQPPAPRLPTPQTPPVPTPDHPTPVDTPPLPEQTSSAPLEAPSLIPSEHQPEPIVEAPLPPTPIERLVPLDLPPKRPTPIAPTLPDPAPLEPTATAFVSRDGDQRLRQILEEGGDSHTEDAVAAALAWIAAAQAPDGRWDGDRWAAGRERQAVLGHDRTGVGLKADLAMTGLSLLALMGAGHTHQEGPFAETIHDGLSFLVRTQHADGALYGQASPFAKTYCHSMAAFALAEAYAVTGDERLQPTVRRAVDFLVKWQDPRTGGWRYQQGDPGDMSQLGWILMALRSAELAGVDVPPRTWNGIERFVRSTQRGASGGLSSYRPNSTPSHSMTAESFYCRQILGRPIAGPTAVEAVDAIVSRPPGYGRTNLYAWYYATLALHHHRRESGSADHAWREWNNALKRNLVTTQVTDGVNKGSWSPNTVWGGCGGRVYTTALATMCLEVYYRYDPSGLSRDPWIAAREYPATLR